MSVACSTTTACELISVMRMTLKNKENTDYRLIEQKFQKLLKSKYNNVGSELAVMHDGIKPTSKEQIASKCA